jgi:hypothetical protein
VDNGDADESALSFAGPGIAGGSVKGDGTANCPEGFPVKGNEDSMIFHAQSDALYEQTIPEYCFATIEDAIAAGYRPTEARALGGVES